jgi:hypothetical protein
MLDKYGLYADAEARDYSRYQDALADYYKRLGLAENRLADAEAKDWEKYVHDENIAYQLDRDAIDDAYRNKQYEEGVRQYNTSMAYNEKQAALDRAHNKEMAELENKYAVADREDKQSHEYLMSGYEEGRKAYEDEEFDGWTMREHEEYVLGMVKADGNVSDAKKHIAMLEEYGYISPVEGKVLLDKAVKAMGKK